MTNSPNEGPESRPNRRLWLLILRRGGIALAMLIFLGGIAGVIGIWIFVNRQLSPRIQEALTNILNRPVQVGKVERFTLNGLRIGPSEIPATANDPDTASVQAVEVGFDLLHLLRTRTLRLELVAIAPDVYLEQDKEGNWLDTTLNLEGKAPIEFEFSALRLRDADVVLSPAPAEGEKRQPFEVNQIQGAVNLLDRNQKLRLQLSGKPTRGGSFDLKGNVLLAEKKANIMLQAEKLRIPDLGRLVQSTIPLPVDLKAGLLDCNLTATYQHGVDQLPDLLGDLRVKGLTAQIDQVPQSFNNAEGRLRFSGQSAQLEEASTNYGQVPVKAKGSIDLKKGFDITAWVDSVSLEQGLETLQVQLPVPVNGEVRVDLQVTGKFDQPVLSGQVMTLGPARLDRLDLRRVSAGFSLAPPNLQLTDVVAIPAVGGQVTGQGELKLGDNGGVVVDFQAQNLPGDAIAELYGVPPNANYLIGNLFAQGQVFGPLNNWQALIDWQAPDIFLPVQGQAIPAQGQIAIAGSDIVLRNATAQLAGGTIRAAGRLRAGSVQARIEADRLPLDLLSRDIKGQASAAFNVSAPLDAFSLETVRAAGQIRLAQVSLPQGISLEDRPLAAQVRWDGQRVQIDRATAPGLIASGVFIPQLVGANAFGRSRINLNVKLSNFNLRSLAASLPDIVKLRGAVDFAGQVTGTLETARVMGNLRLQHLALNQVAFEPILQGGVRFGLGQGASLQLAGNEDRIAAVLDQNYQPVSFEVKRDEAIARGRSLGKQRLGVEVQHFPIAMLNLAPAADQGLGPLTGKFSGNFDVNLAQMAAVGDFAIAKPSLGHIAADRFTGNIRYANGAASLTDGKLTQSDSEYLIAANFIPNPEPKFDGNIQVARGNLQDVLKALQWFDLSDLARGVKAPTYDTAAALALESVGDPNAPLMKQLRRLAEIRALLEQQQEKREKASPLPPFKEIEGNFDGNIAFGGSLQDGIMLDFKLKGQDWQWGKYKANTVILNGGFEDNILTLLPLRLEADKTLFTFAGQIGGESQSGQLKAENVPVEAIRDFATLPIDITGNLNATATLAGTPQNPQARGQIELIDGTLSQEPIDSALGSFSYNNGRLDFGSTIVVTEPQPFEISGSIPYTLPFANVYADSDEIELDIDIKDKALSLLNLFNDQIAWESGSGEVKLKVRGQSILRSKITGKVSLTNATFSSSLLPDPLTAVNGTVTFEGDRLRVNDLKGQFSKGQITAQGVLPLLLPLSATGPDSDKPDPDLDNPLTITLDKLAMNLKGIYRGGVNGDLIISGTAIAPQIGGDVVLSGGQVFLPETAGTAGTVPDPAIAAAEFSAGRSWGQPRLENLNLTLGKRILIVRPPILNFRASGNLTVNGFFNNLKPEGEIDLNSGQVNLFTTQFTLSRGHDHKAIFEGSLDPRLDVRMNTTVTEVNRPATNNKDVFDTEISESIFDDGLGSARTILIEAKVEGHASRLFDELQLTSTPARNETEIVALLGGSFIDTFGRGDTTLGLANLAGSVLLTNIQNFIGDALGVTDFRLFPATILEGDTDETGERETLGLGAELGFNITRDLSVSVLRILTSANQPTRFNVRYRVNDEIQLRTSTDFSDDTRAVVEYELRF